MFSCLLSVPTAAAEGLVAEALRRVTGAQLLTADCWRLGCWQRISCLVQSKLACGVQRILHDM